MTEEYVYSSGISSHRQSLPVCLLDFFVLATSPLAVMVYCHIIRQCECYLSLPGSNHLYFNSSFASVAGDDPKLSFDFNGEKYASDDGEPEQFADALSWVGGGYDTPAGPGRSVSSSSSLSDLQMAYAGATGE